MEQLKNIIIQKINAGEIAMRPRWKFVLETTLLLLGIIMTALLIVYIASLAVYILQYTGALYIPTFGMAGILPFLFSIPWTLLILAIVFVIILEFLVHKFSFVYRKPLLYSVFGIVVISIFGTYVVLQTSVHSILQERVERKGIPIVGFMYHGYADVPARNVLFGEVIELTEVGLILNDIKKGEIRVALSELLEQVTEVQVGDMVLVFGQLDDGVVVARGLRIINDDTVLPLPPHRINSSLHLKNMHERAGALR